MKRRRADKIFFGIVVALALVGIFIFTSASLGLFARDGAAFSTVALKQIIFGTLGVVSLLFFANLDYRIWKKYSFYIFMISLALVALVFVSSIGFSSGGATRWIDLGLFTFQPAELLKFGFIVYFAALLSSLKTKVYTTQYGLLPMVIFLVVIGGILLKQPDMGTLMVIVVTAIAMFIGANGKWSHIGVVSAGIIIVFILVLFTKPYAMERVLTFLEPGRDPLGASYQLQQSLIAVGSGEVAGRGFGQSIQKFKYLPEPTGDSIFAVAAEEFGFIGSTILVGLFLAFAYRGLHIANRAPTQFGGLLVLGLVILIVVQSFINISSMLGLFPLTGMPLLFVSQGGTALFFTLLEAGVILNVSKYKKNKLI